MLWILEEYNEDDEEEYPNIDSRISLGNEEITMCCKEEVGSGASERNLFLLLVNTAPYMAIKCYRLTNSIQILILS
jgi:hypothetical protein